MANEVAYVSIGILSTAFAAFLLCLFCNIIKEIKLFKRRKQNKGVLHTAVSIDDFESEVPFDTPSHSSVSLKDFRTGDLNSNHNNVYPEYRNQQFSQAKHNPPSYVHLAEYRDSHNIQTDLSTWKEDSNSINIPLNPHQNYAVQQSNVLMAARCSSAKPGREYFV